MPRILPGFYKPPAVIVFYKLKRNAKCGFSDSVICDSMYVIFAAS